MWQTSGAIMKLQAPVTLTLLALGVLLACGRSEHGDDHPGAGGTGAAGGTGGAPTADWEACERNSDCVLTGNPELHATCAGGVCLAVDIRAHQASACASDDDCRLRVTGCCECGGSTASWDLIAIAQNGEPAYQSLVCDPEQGCDDCAPVYPTDTEAYCATDGHCATRATSATTPPFPCGAATPVIDATTGLEQCSRGYQRRVAPAKCPSLVPRAAAIPNYSAAIDECEHDADCPSATYGPYAHCGVRTGGSAHVCVAGCTLDRDCADNGVCLCGDPVGRCVPASCSTGADCTLGFDCAAYASLPGCFSTQFACQTADDACGSDGDCAGKSPNAAFCVLDGAARACSIAQCTML